MEKFLEIETKTRQGVEKFYEDIKTSENLNEIINHINFQIYSSENSINFNLFALSKSSE